MTAGILFKVSVTAVQALVCCCAARCASKRSSQLQQTGKCSRLKISCCISSSLCMQCMCWPQEASTHATAATKASTLLRPVPAASLFYILSVWLRAAWITRRSDYMSTGWARVPARSLRRALDQKCFRNNLIWHIDMMSNVHCGSYDDVLDVDNLLLSRSLWTPKTSSVTRSRGGDPMQPHTSTLLSLRLERCEQSVDFFEGVMSQHHSPRLGLHKDLHQHQDSYYKPFLH